MASSVRLLIAAIGALFNLVVVYLLLFVDGIIKEPLTKYVLNGQYTGRVYGMDILPIIQWALVALCLFSCVFCVFLAYREVYAEVVYYPEY